MKRMLPIVFWLSLVGLGCESAVEAQTDARVVVADASATPDAQSNDLDAEVSPVPDVGSVIDSAIPDAGIFDMATARDAQAEMDIDVIVDADTRDMNLPDQDSEEPDRGVADRFEDQVLAVCFRPQNWGNVRRFGRAISSNSRLRSNAPFFGPAWRCCRWDC